MPDLSLVASVEDVASAEALAEMLRRNGVPSIVRPVSPVPGIVEEVEVHVLASLAHRARWLMQSNEVTDTELLFAATGELGKNED